MGPDEASELAEFLDMCIEERERTGERLSAGPFQGFCPLAAPTHWVRPGAPDAARALGISNEDAQRFIFAFDGRGALSSSPTTELAFRYRRIALGEEPRPWAIEAAEALGL